MSMRLIVTVGFAAAFAAAASAQEGPAPAAQPKEKKSGYASRSAGPDHHFVQEAARGGMVEVELGRLAAEKASSPEVKQFGQKMVDDHSKANDELKQLASKKNLTVPGDVDPAQEATKARLSKLSGAAFDKAYMDAMVKDHEKDVKEFQREASSGADPDVKAWSAKTLPTLQEHDRMAKDIHAKVAGPAPSTEKKP